MLVSWNVRGLKKIGKHKEVISHLLSLKVDIIVLLETRVKRYNVVVRGNNLKLPGRYLDNYDYHASRRIWLNWKDNKIEIIFITSINKMVHCEVREVHESFKFWLTVIYAHNKLDLQR